MRALRALRRMAASHRPVLMYPVGRRLMACTLAYLAGVLLSVCFSLPPALAAMLGVLLLAAALWGYRSGRRTLLPIALIFLVAGNAAAGCALRLRDLPTAPGTEISGTVMCIEGENRVMLGDVCLPDGETTNRHVIVTLMSEEEDPSLLQMPHPGQRLGGVGRLFAQDEMRNPGGVDGRLRALGEGYELSGYILPGWTVEGRARFSLTEAFRVMRQRLSEKLTQLLGENSPLFMALMLGDTQSLDAELTGAMRLTGTAHVLSVSGMHLTMVSAALHGLFSFLCLRRKTSIALQAAATLLFAGLTGFAVGTVRALIMQFVAMLARLRGRRYDPLTALSLSALLIAIASPLSVFGVGFQYSFFVVFGIHLLGQGIESLPPMRWLRARFGALAEMVAISLSAQLAALPVQLSLYGYVPLLALPMNLLCSAVMPFLMIGGWLLLAVGFAAPQAAAIASVILTYPAGLFQRISLAAAGVHGSILRLPAPARPMMILFGVVMALLSSRIRFGRARWRVCASLIVLMTVLYLPQFNPAVRYVQLDVGQGDAALIRSGRHAVVIDVGPAYSYDLLRYLRSEGLFVDTLILSHLDEDHAGSLAVLCSAEVDVGRVIMAECAAENVESQAVLEGLALLEEQGIPVEFVTAGDSFEAINLRFDVLSPTDDLRGSNERSLLLHAGVGDCALLLAGDLAKGSEPQEIPACDLLKVAHHGSKNASSDAFLQKASPEVAIISVGGGNSYGHPHARVLDGLEAVGAKTVRTDQSGCITVWLQEDMRIDTFL